MKEDVIKNLIFCSDGAHGITIEKFPPGEIGGDALIGFWYLGVQKRQTFWQRVKLAWRVFREHSICFDELCVSESNVKDVIVELEKITNGES